jgi:hypothetical protein
MFETGGKTARTGKRISWIARRTCATVAKIELTAVRMSGMPSITLL